MLMRIRKIDMDQWVIFIILTIMGAFMLLPVIFIVNHAFKPINELFLFPPTFFVDQPTTQNFKNLFLATAGDIVPFTRYLFNSIVIATLTLGSVISKTNKFGKRESIKGCKA